MSDKVLDPIVEDQLVTLPWTTIREMGLLQEVNRLFFHPRGLALCVDFDRDEEGNLVETGKAGVYDFRGDDGIEWDPEYMSTDAFRAKASKSNSMILRDIQKIPSTQKAEFKWNANRYQDNAEDSRAAFWIAENGLEPNSDPVQAAKPFCILDNCSAKPWDSFLDESNECYIHLTSVIPRGLFLKIYTRVEQLSGGSTRIRTSGTIEYGGQKLLTLVKENGYFEFAIEDFQSEPQLEALSAIKGTLQSWALACYDPEYQDPEVTIGEMREAREEWYEFSEKLKIDLDC